MKKWIHAFRLRTLPLSFSCIVVGNALGWSSSHKTFILILSLATTLCLQILSNLANDLGDTLNGVDNKNRIGPLRSVQSGSITISSMKRMIVVFILCSLVFGMSLIYISFSSFDFSLIVVGILAIIAALFYTLGKRPYGYLGLGDLFVFMFFGIAGVMGCYYLHVHKIDLSILLPASSIGLLSTGVLNCNNVRDAENDRLHNKITIPVRIGLSASINYQYILIITAWLCILTYIIFWGKSMYLYIVLLCLPLFIRHLKNFSNAKTRSEYDPELKNLSLSTFILALLFSIGCLL